jgi:hypothetical protein
MRTQKQREASDKGTEAEKFVVRWLGKRGFHIDYSHEGKKSNLPYDIKATKRKERWVIDVKSGKAPFVKIPNFAKMLEEEGYNRVGLALVEGRRVYLLQYRKMSLAGEKAAETRRRRVLLQHKRMSLAGTKGWETRRKHARDRSN